MNTPEIVLTIDDKRKIVEFLQEKINNFHLIKIIKDDEKDDNKKVEYRIPEGLGIDFNSEFTSRIFLFNEEKKQWLAFEIIIK